MPIGLSLLLLLLLNNSIQIIVRITNLNFKQ